MSKNQAASPLVHTNDKYQSQQVGNGSHSHIENNRTISTPIQQHSYHHNYVDIEEDPDLLEIHAHPSYSHYQHQLHHQQQHPYQYQATEHGFRMTGNGFFSNNSSGPLMKSKSGSLPGRYSTRGFRDTFISSMNNTTALSANSSPQHLAQIQPNQNQNMSDTPTTPTKDPQKDSAGKKWTFGGLFKRKVKASNSHPLSSSPSVLGNPSPVSVTLSSSPAPSGNAIASVSHNPNRASSLNNTPVHHHHGMSRTKYLASRKGKPSESDLSSYDSEIETENNYPPGGKRQSNQLRPSSQSQSQSQTPLSFKQNFLTRRLSKRKEKAAKKAAAAENSHNGFLKVPSQLQNGRRVGSSPDSLNNSGGMNGPWQSWETTKKVPANNYSSSGSLSLSMEGSSKGSRIAAKEAVKARAIARRESYFRESSSSDGETGDTEERSRSSLQGSHSSLSSRNRRHRALNYQASASASRRPELIRGSPSSPVVLSHNVDPQMNPQQNKISAPGSPRWEARIIYQQENLIENDGPVVVKLPKNGTLNNSNQSQQPNTNQNQNQNQRPNYYQQFESPHGNVLLSTSTNSDDQGTGKLPVITAGLRVPIVQTQNNVNPNPNAYMTEEVTYANLPNISSNPSRSITPYNNYHSVSPSPPPPPPRRDFARNQNQNLQQQHPNFYRPVSCSYLDSYQYHQQQQLQQQQQGIIPPNYNGGSGVGAQFDNRNSFYNNNSHLLANGNGHNGETENPPPDSVTNGYFEHEIEIQPPAVSFSPRNNNFLAPQSFAHHVGRSPSEPPEIKVQFARDSPHRMASPSPYNNNGGSGWNGEMNGNSSSPSKYNNQHQPVIMSKLGFPVRRLHEVNKLPPTQSPIHMRASEFWRRKEQETVSGGTPSQKRFLSRVRSADSSPLPVPRMRNSPATLLNSNESISSLSSFSAEAPSPNLFSTPKSSKIQSGPLRPQTLVLKTPGFQLINSEKDKESSKSKEKVQNQSACERLKVRLPNGQSPSSTPVPPPSSQQQQQPQKESETEQTATPTKNNNKDPSSVKSPGRNLEDALNELEDMYKSLRLSDEDLLDRAERRDLPTAHQELRNAPMLPQSFQGSVESLATGSSGSNYTYGFHSTENLNRVRAPPLRRSSRPDVENDDMAKRRYDHPDHPAHDPRSVVSKTGSYMVLSPAFSPPSSPCPPTPGAQQSVSSLLGLEDPDLTFDDVTFRNYKRANSIKIIEPQPPFGIPNVPVAPAPDSDYLHSKPVEKYRPIFRHVKRPDIVKDDIAFRNLRKDLNFENNLSKDPRKDWTPRLFSPTRENVFNYNIKPEQRNKKLRAIRSLSANISHLIPFKESAVNSEIGKWNSFTDLNCEESPAGSRASSYLQPSWVEQIEKVQTSTETLTENRNVNSNKGRFSAEERIMAATTGAMKLVTPIGPYDPSKPRRPWTDILLESFEREKQAEIDRIAAETAADAEKAALEQKTQIQLAQSSQLHPENSVEEDDDVFEDAREEAKSTSPDDPTKNRSRYATPEIPTLLPMTHPSAFHLLAGQKNRRGSWVESKSSSLLSSENDDEEKRRRSWSDVPKDMGAGSAFLFSCPPNSPAKKSLFNPLPPPRKIKQINLNAFNTGAKQPILSEGEGEIEAELENLSEIQRNLENDNMIEKIEKTVKSSSSTDYNNSNVNKAPSHEGSKLEEKQTESRKAKCSVSPTLNRLTTKRVLSPKSPLSPRSPTRGEDELNELMDALLREADTCGPPTTRRRVRPSSRVKQENNNTISQGKEKETSEPEQESTPNPTPIVVSVVVPANNSAMPKGNRIPLPKNPLEESASEKVVSAPGSCSGSQSRTNTSIANTSPPSPKSTNENIDNNTPKVGKVPKSDSIEDLIDSINESLPELEASCFKNNNYNQPNSSNSTAVGTTSECYIVSSTTTSTIPPPLSLDSLKESQSRVNEIKHQDQQHQHQDSSLQNLQMQNSEEIITVPDENENHETIFKEKPQEDQKSARKSSLDTLDIVDDDFQLGAKGKDNNGSRRGSNNTITPSTSSSKPSSADAGALSKSKAEESLCETNERYNGNGCKSKPEDKTYPKGKEDEKFRGEKQIGRKPVAPAFVSTPSGKQQQERETTGNTHFSESPCEVNKPLIPTPIPTMRISTSRSRSHSLIGSVSTSPTNTSENGENKKEKDKSYRRKSHLNRAFTEEPVPNENFSIDIETNERKRNRQLSHDGSSLESSNVEDAPRMQKLIQKAPNIPSIFSKSEKQSPNTTPVHTNHAPQNRSPLTKGSPSPKLQNKSPAISCKAQTFEKKGSPVTKRDSFSDAEGVNFIKKFLQKESEKTGDKSAPQNIKTPVSNVKDSAFCLKKSPSAGSNSYWSRFSNSQPAFLKRFFDRPEKAAAVNENDNSTVLANNKASKLPEPKTARSVSVQPKEPEPVMGFSVAQKASFFMKLEHEQRFSKWRKNSDAGIDVSSQQSVNVNNNSIRPKSRHLTQPVTPTEVEYASQYFTENINGEAKSDIKAEELFRNIMEYPLTSNGIDETAPLGIQHGRSSSYNDCDDSFPPENLLDPSKLSLKDRVHMFDSIVTTSTKPPSSSSVAPTPRPPSKIFGNFVPKTNGTLAMMHPSGLPPSSTTTYSTTTVTSTTNFMNHPNLNAYGEQMYDPGNSFPVIRRRGSTSDVELSSTPKYSPIMPRSFKVKSMFMGGHKGDSDNFSEDGEVSSGGQEVAEIISKSYENSPIFRKKTWRSQQKQTQANFSKDIWRKCVAQENWTAPQPTYEQPLGNYIMENVKPSAPSPPATSNLLPILTALSSSNDELNDPKPIPRKIPRSTFSSNSSSTTDIRNKTEVCVKVPHPDDESFQTFFTNDNSNFAFRNFEGAQNATKNQNPTQFSNFQTGATADSGAEGFDRSSGISLEEISAVERQSDLLVMKKNMPVVRRKSSGKSRNPLKALAARMDFRNQKYTETHIADDKVPNEDQQL